MLALIEQHLDSFSPAERRVADWVLAHPDEARSLTLAELAQTCGTSQPTIIRFCRHVGLAGFREFGLKLTEALSRPHNLVHRAVREGDSPAAVSEKVFDSAVQALMQQRKALREIDIERAVKLMAAARQIVFVGFGSSGHVADDARHKFFRLGIPCSAMTNSPGVRQLASIAVESDLFVMISNSGRWEALAEAARLVTERGAHVIAITNPASELARFSSVVLASGEHDETSVYTPMNSRIAQLVILDVLQVALALELGDAAVTNLRRTKQALTGDLST